MQLLYNDAVAKTMELDNVDEDAALSGSSARNLPPASSEGPPAPRIRRLHAKTPQTSTEEKEWPAPNAHKSSRKASAETERKSKQSARTAFTLQEYHLDKKTFDQHHLAFNGKQPLHAVQILVAAQV